MSPEPPVNGLSERLPVFLGFGRELRQRCARERWSLIEFACVALTGKMKTYKLSIKSMV